MPSAPTQGVRVAELVATLSYAADLGLGQPMAHCMRQTVIALRLAELAGATPGERSATYYLGLMFNAYCHADAAEQASWFGDDIAFKSDTFDLLGMNTAQIISFLVRRVGGHGSGLQRARRLAGFPRSSMKKVTEFLNTHSRLGAQFAEQIGLDEIAVRSFRHGYAQWDGKGVPRGLAGASITLPARLVQVAGPVEVYARRYGVDGARKAAVRHRGADFDPAIVDLFCTNASAILDGLDEASEWDAILDAEPSLSPMVDGSDLDSVLEAMADLADLKSPHFAGRSRGVANLAAEAARLWRMSEADILTVRRAGLLHDLGRLGVSNAIWDKPGPLSASEREHVRIHPYLTERMLAGVSALTASCEVAGRHHERLDGSGYPRGLTATSLRPLDRLLAVADVYHAMSEPRPYRLAIPPEQAAAELAAEVRAGRLDGDAVAAVLKAAGKRSTARRAWPNGLTAREVEVLGLLARGRTNKQIADLLTVTPKTVANHTEHIYTKIGVSSRAAATLFASQHGLVGAFEAEDR
ncbi:metal-dependent phosphohydrolase [Rhizocola hellebori]|uniref:Metal-dependent phosphohydrolase n=1 Tax=Rhizocola hellebori TaxID=1392758 RepID=A0A8J3Q7F6_9ACTN|nr:HD domain-containing phosphohydrolase [Rhizocola hellebori]GIH05220.1 metal-dependent phosphohydrolase [Rhizocola hellebori]